MRNLFCYVKSRARLKEKAFHLGAEEVPPPAGEVCCSSPTSTLCSPDAGLPAAPLAPHAPQCPFPSQSPSLWLSHLHASLCHPMPWQGREQAGEAAGLTHEASHSPQDLPAQLPVPPCALAQPGRAPRSPSWGRVPVPGQPQCHGAELPLDALSCSSSRPSPSLTPSPKHTTRSLYSYILHASVSAPERLAEPPD